MVVGVVVAELVAVEVIVVVVVGVVVCVVVAVVVVVGVEVGEVVGVERWHSLASIANVPSKIPPMAPFNADAVASHRAWVLANQFTLSHVIGWTVSAAPVNLLSAVVSTLP